MGGYEFSLFGKFQARFGVEALTESYTPKVQELLCYLLLHRDRSHPRESLAELLSANSSTAQSKKNLRQVLWQLQTLLNSHLRPPAVPILLADSEWVNLNAAADLWIDVAVFEQAFSQVKGMSGEACAAAQVLALRNAVELYHGDLLEGWYQDWCLYERERLQSIYLAMLDKLMSYDEAHAAYDTAIVYGSLALQRDQARERTHRRLMRLYYLADDRAAALRQYDQCKSALRQELGVQPSKKTTELYRQIQADQLEESAPVARSPSKELHVQKALGYLHQLQTDLAATERRVQQAVKDLEHVLESLSG